MVGLSNDTDKKIMPCDYELTKLLNYIYQNRYEEPFELRQLKDDDRYFLRQDKDGYSIISFARAKPHTLSEDVNSRGYIRIKYKGNNILKHRLIYQLYGYIPVGTDFDKMEVHHKNGNIRDNRLENLCLISAASHKILHILIDKYGIDNIEL